MNLAQPHKSYKRPLSLNDPKTWIRGVDFSAPESESELARVQSELDSILGLTRDNKSKAIIVWNGDVRYWKEIYVEWDRYGHPTTMIKRPHLLYKSITDEYDRVIRDVYVPRYIVLTRIEPEQYADDWEETTKFWSPEHRRWVPYRPVEPPKDYYIWFSTISTSANGCCQKTASKKAGATCFCNYAPPASYLPLARQIRKGLEFTKTVDAPFDAPNAVARKIRERANHNYEEQAMRKFNQSASHLLLENPFMALSDETLANGASVAKIQAEAQENLKRSQDRLERRLKNLRKQGVIK